MEIPRLTIKQEKLLEVKNDAIKVSNFQGDIRIFNVCATNRRVPIYTRQN